MIKLKDLLGEESAAAKQAKAKGLKSKGFGNWADSSGKVVAQTKDDKLVMTKKAKEPSEKKSKKKKAKDTGDVGGPAHPNVPKKDSKKKDVKKKVDNHSPTNILANQLSDEGILVHVTNEEGTPDEKLLKNKSIEIYTSK